MENISLIPREEGKSGFLNKLSFLKKPEFQLSPLSKLGLILIGVILLITGGLYFWKYQLNNQAKAFNTELQKLTGQRDLSLENRLKDLNSVLEIFKGVLDDHRYWTQFFELLEAKTLNSVTFLSLDVDDLDNIVTLSGTAPSYSAMAQQVKIFEDTPNIVSVDSSNIGLSGKGKINFDLKIKFSKDILIKK